MGKNPEILERHWAKQRRSMVDEQIIVRGIHNPLVLQALREIPRHEFIPEDYWSDAYADRPLPIGNDQTISQPYMVAIMTEWLNISSTDRVLEIGTGSGYQCAILARLAAEVVTFERHAHLSVSAHNVLEELGFKNIRFEVGDGSLGWLDAAPYDAILVTAGAPSVPNTLMAQLAEGGRLVVPVGNRELQNLVRITRHGDRFDQEMGIGCRFVPLIGSEGWE